MDDKETMAETRLKGMIDNLLPMTFMGRDLLIYLK
jgi:hypothetical protein